MISDWNDENTIYPSKVQGVIRSIEGLVEG